MYLRPVHVPGLPVALAEGALRHEQAGGGGEGRGAGRVEDQGPGQEPQGIARSVEHRYLSIMYTVVTMF